jgi:hypothetical protein
VFEAWGEWMLLARRGVAQGSVNVPLGLDSLK